jgi:transposase
MQYRTILIASVPRANCETHGVRQIEVPWSEPGGRFTSLFEALAIDWLLDASISAVAAQLGLTWDQVAGIQQRAVERGFRRRRRCPPYQIGVDETSFARRHEYVTVVSDLEDGCVLHVGDDHRRDTLEAYYKGLGSRVCANLDVVVMDMWGPYVNATKTYVPDAESRIVFDKFHIAKNLGDAVDQVRKKENRGLRERGDTRLVGTKYLWLRNPHKMNRSQLLDFGRLRYSRLKVARAWAMKEAAMSLWGYLRRGWAVRMWKRWLSWAKRSRLEPMKRVARMIERYFYGVINAATRPETNARAEALNSRIQEVKRRARGYRNRERFRDAIYFHLGGLDLYPRGAQMAHTKP